MSDAVIKVESVSKLYRLGEVGTGSLAHDVNRWWHRVRGKENPYSQVGQVNDRTKKAGSDWVWALKDINFEVKRGEVLGIIGRNGAGKSTLLKILSRVTAPTSGQVKVKGRIASLLEVGTGFHPDLTGRENVYLNGAILGMRKLEIDRKLDEIVEFSGCAAYLETPVKRYSSGMQVRLAFAVAAHLEPEILVVDEVLAVGDAEFQKKCLGKIGEVAKVGRTVLFVSHNMAAVATLCDRVTLLDAGGLVFDGTSEAGITQYFNQQQVARNHFIRAQNAASSPVQITEIELCSDKGVHVDIVDNSKPLFIRIHYRADDIGLGAIIPSISVSNNTGLKLFQHHSRLNRTIFSDLPPVGMLTLRLPKIPLPASTYKLSAYLMTQIGEVDRVDDALEFTVSDSSYYSSGETTPATHGVTLVDGEWSLAVSEN